MTDAEYLEWKLDVRNNAYRITLIELNHAGGTVYLASKPWLSNTNIAYDCWLIDIPFTEESLISFAGVGNINAVNLDPKTDWASLLFHGHEGKLYSGDIRWTRNHFRQTATAVIDSCTFVGEKEYQFNLLDAGTRLKRTLVNADETKTLDVLEAVEWVEEKASLSVGMINVSDEKLDWNLSFDVTSKTEADEVLRGIADSVGGYLRLDQIGNIDIVIPDNNSKITITDSMIGIDGAQMTENIPPYATIVVEKSDGTEITETTDADTGVLSREYRVSTWLTSTSDAEDLAAELVSFYADHHAIWDLSVFGASDLFACGDSIIIDHSKLKTNGTVRYVGRSDLSNETSVEVMT